MADAQDLAVIGQQSMIRPEVERFELEQRMAKLFALSGLFKDVQGQSQEQSIAQAYVKIALGGSMGFSPAESMQGIDIIQGRPSVGAQLRAARMQRAGYSWKVERLDDSGCKLRIFQGAVELGEVSFLEEDAKRAKLIDKDNWKKDPSSMYFARAITRAQRRFAPGVLSMNIMSTEEAVDWPDSPPPSDRVRIATENKTEELANKLQAARSSSVVDVKPEPMEPVNQRRADAGMAPATETPVNEWPERCTKTWLAVLGEPEFKAVLHAVLGTDDVAAVNASNEKAVWAKMTEAKNRVGGEKKFF